VPPLSLARLPASADDDAVVVRAIQAITAAGLAGGNTFPAGNEDS
jgi:hypothetical protein